MCEKDGGVRIFEVVEIPARNYESRLNSLGNFDIPLDDAKAGDAPFVHRVKRTYIREANPSVWKHELMVIRRSDQKVLGVQVTYSRVGGDFPSPAHRSSFSCPEQAIDLFSVVIKQKKAEEK